jgi:hypothetical protein
MNDVPMNEDVDIRLAIDASFEPDRRTPTNDAGIPCNNGPLLYATPANPNLPDFPVHLKLTKGVSWEPNIGPFVKVFVSV